MPEHPVDVVSQVVADHRAVESLFADLAAGRGDRPAVVQVIVRELSLHAGVEELVVYPAVAERVPSGGALVDTDLAQHQALKDVLVRLDGADPHAATTSRDLAEAQRLVAQHVAHEEGTVLPALQAVLGVAELASLGDAFLRAKEKAPTHPHPRAPNRPPLNAIADAAAAIVDRTRDVIRRRRESR
jgi:hypothetical protein